MRKYIDAKLQFIKQNDWRNIYAEVQKPEAS